MFGVNTDMAVSALALSAEGLPAPLAGAESGADADPLKTASARSYFFIRSRTAADMASTPVRMVGEGIGAKSAEWRPGTGIPFRSLSACFSEVGGADPQKESRNPTTRQAEQAEVFAAHFGVPIHDTPGSQGGDEDRFEPRSQSRVVIGDRCHLCLADRHDRACGPAAAR